MLRYMTAGESHGRSLLAVIEGVPYGTPIDLDFINSELARRQGGYGRGARMKIESDRVEALSGIRHGYALGSPVTLMIANKVQNIEDLSPISRPRPGHADFAGAMKYGVKDARDISERSSARETAARVAAGALANGFLQSFGIRVLGYVVEIGGVPSQVKEVTPDTLAQVRENSPFYVLDSTVEAAIRAKVDEARARGDTLGGFFEVSAFGIPPGLGSYVSWESKLDGRLARALMSVQTVKAVEIGMGSGVAKLSGAQVHDPILPGGKRGSNNAGGIEGGMSNGQPIVVRTACKPISTLRNPLPTVDLQTGESAQAQYERSDVCVVPAASVIGQAVVSFELAAVFLEKFGADTYEEVQQRFDGYRRRIGEGGNLSQ